MAARLLPNVINSLSHSHLGIAVMFWLAATAGKLYL